MNNNFARWTPYQDRADVWGAQREEEMASREEAGESPTSSQIAKKRLGFENLFDKTDPDVQEIDDVVDMGLLSGRSVEAEIFSHFGNSKCTPYSNQYFQVPHPKASRGGEGGDEANTG